MLFQFSHFVCCSTDWDILRHGAVFYVEYASTASSRFNSPPHPSPQAFVAPLPVRALPGIGYKTSSELQKLGVATVADARALSGQQLAAALGDKIGKQLWLLLLFASFVHCSVLPLFVIEVQRGSVLASDAGLSA